VSERAPGWYPDSSVPGHERWWDGGTWSHVTRPVPGGATDRTDDAKPAAPPVPTSVLPDGLGPDGPGPGGPVGYGTTPPSAGRMRAVTTPDGLPLSGAGARLGARILDQIVLSIAAAIVGFPLVRQILDSTLRFLEQAQQAAASGAQPNVLDLLGDQQYLAASSGLAMVQLALSGIYHISLIATRGATLGKLAVGIRVRPWTADRRPTWGEAALRWAGRDVVSLLPMIGPFYLLLDSLWLLRDESRQCLHDKVPKTCVIRGR
jgi:uncharacterized RDD family membrane protein YckC